MPKKTLTRRRSDQIFDTVKLTLEVLNGKQGSERSREMQIEFRRVIELWIASGPDLVELKKRNPELVPVNFNVSTYPLRDGRLGLTCLAADNPKETPTESARVLFWSFLLHPNCLNLGGPCACGCGQWFIRSGKYGKRCLKGHSSRASASKRMREKQAKDRAPKIAAVNRALAKYKRDRERGDWKEYVEAELNFKYVTIQTLETWERKGWITTPGSGQQFQKRASGVDIATRKN
jgi:hypothetical protein